MMSIYYFEKKKRKNTFTDEIDLLRKFISQFFYCAIKFKRVSNPDTLYYTQLRSRTSLNKRQDTEEEWTKEKSNHVKKISSKI